MVEEDLINKVLQENLEKMMKTGALFISSVPGALIWQTYLEGFGKDPKFRDPNSSVHNCNCCSSFFRHYGNLVAIDDNLEIITLFDGDDFPDEYKKSFEDCSKLLRKNKIANQFIETFDHINSLPYERTKKSSTEFLLGFEKNVKIYTQEEADKFGVVKSGEPYTFRHFHIKLPKAYVKVTGKSIEALLGDLRTNKEVFERAMREIPTDTLELVHDLIAQGSLLDGLAHQEKVDSFIPLSKEFNKVEEKKKDNWLWLNAITTKYVRFKNELIGVLCSDLAQGVELNKACQDWNKRVDPANYMKAKAPITKKQIEEARKFVEDNGFADSFDRRCATIDDIKVEDILHSNVGDGKLTAVSIFDKVKPSTCTRHKKSEFKGVEEMPIEKFMKDVLPNCTGIEALFTADHKGNLVTLTTAKDKESKEIFKWHNNFSWTYNGNLAGKSQLQQAVLRAGGKIGVIRFSHSWNELEPNQSLMDAHVFMPGCHYGSARASLDTDGVHDFYPAGPRVGWNNRTDKASGGVQDVDYTQQAPRGYVPVENITFPDISRMPEGKYYYKIHNWAYRNSSGKGKAEIEFDGKIYQYVYPALKNKEWCTVAIVTLKNGVFSIEHKLPLANFDDDTPSENIWNLDTNEFHEVNLICLSPNQWEAGKETGNKHYFFMMNKCKCPDKLRSFHMENLKPELAKHRKVLEVLANQSLIESTDKQLSGLGFDATVRDSIILKLKGSHNRVVKVNF